MVTETESDAVVGMWAPGPRRQETEQASKKKRCSLRRKEGSERMVDRNSGTGDCPVACGVDLALVRAARHCLVPGGQIAQTPTSTLPLHCAHTPV